MANDAWPVAVAWHLALLVAGVLVLGGWRPSRRRAGLLLSLPLLSVGLLAWWQENPFNAVVFIPLAVGQAAAVARSRDAPIREGPRWAACSGGGLVAFAWLYPHFLEGRSPLAYLYAAPTGLVPCPTLALVIGVALAFDVLGFGGAASLAAVGVFYGLFGVFRLGVVLDVLLLGGAAALLARAAAQRR